MSCQTLLIFLKILVFNLPEVSLPHLKHIHSFVTGSIHNDLLLLLSCHFALERLCILKVARSCEQEQAESHGSEAYHRFKSVISGFVIKVIVVYVHHNLGVWRPTHVDF